MKTRFICCLILIVSGCAQESNPVLFGTTTSLGVALNAGSGTDISPGVTVGYGREEVAIVPTVVPNDTQIAERDSRIILAQGSNSGRKDALSTFANFDNRNNSGQGGAPSQFGVRIGSTFATGVAAQYVSLGYLCSLGELTQAQCQKVTEQAAAPTNGG